jgi:hypothetical protein
MYFLVTTFFVGMILAGGACGSIVVEALCYKLEGSGFETL